MKSFDEAFKALLAGYAKWKSTSFLRRGWKRQPCSHGFLFVPCVVHITATKKKRDVTFKQSWLHADDWQISEFKTI